jgi:predicted Holliday junction resolvase-like endonuclease
LSTAVIVAIVFLATVALALAVAAVLSWLTTRGLRRENARLVKSEQAARKDAVRRSLATTTGKVAEQLAPCLPGFPYNHGDCRFIGSPIDFLIFNGMTDGEVNEIVFLEVKARKSQLITVQRTVRDLVRAGAVRWDEYRPPLESVKNSDAAG